jgi:hypothetical protein
MTVEVLLLYVDHPGCVFKLQVISKISQTQLEHMFYLLNVEKFKIYIRTFPSLMNSAFVGE